MLSFFKLRTLLLLIGLLLVSIFIWFAGAYFAFGVYRPLESDLSRAIAILLVVGCWIAWRLIRRWRVRRATGQLAAAVVSQARPEPERPSAEAAKLRERFEEAVATLSRGSGRSLYDLPWYVFIGAPGSGKTTALVNSGLKFPLEQRVGKAAVRGVGGTRNCDWWFTDEAVFLDTAGRYTTQDSDAASDSEGWKEFLALLAKYRERRPVNGIVLTISAQDLLTQGDSGREAHVEAARRRLTEFTTSLRVQLPVYVMVTKCDMVAGFSEYFDDLAQDARSQVWGVTFPYEQSLSNDAPDVFPSEFDALMERLNGRVFDRLEAERGPRRRAMVFAFPQQMAALRDVLAQFVSDVFSGPHFHRQILLRGVYFTSGTQDGTQIDRLLGAIGRRFGIAKDAVAAPEAGRGKAYFVERLLKQVIIGESGLAGVNRRLELRKAAWQIGAYAAILIVLVAGVVALTMSYSANRAYLTQVAADVATLRRVPAAGGIPSLQVVIPRLDAVRAVFESANRYETSTPWSMRWGLYQGSSVGNSARDAYLRELDSLLLPRFVARVRQHLSDYASDPERLFVYLKAYLMLGDPTHLDKKHLEFLADVEWKMPETTPGAGTSLANHFKYLLDHGETLRPVALDPAIVAQARSTIRSASIPQIMYGQLQRHYSDDAAHALQFDVIAGVGIEKVLKRKSGRRLSEPFPSLYTQRTFKEITGGGIAPLIKRFADDEWVWGTKVSPASWPRLLAQVTGIYEQDYDKAWDGLLDDLEIVPFSTVQQYADALGIIAGPTSPLRGILKTVVDNTSLVAASGDAAPSAAAPSVGTRLAEGARDLFSAAQKKITGVSSAPPGTVITEHFRPIQRLMAGAPAPIDGTFEQIRKIRDQLLKVGPQVGGAQPLKAITDPTLLELWRALEQDTVNLPPPVNGLIRQIALHASVVVSGDATRQLDQQYQDEVVAPCRVRVQGRYPFGTSSDMPIADFGEVFGYGGIYDRFFTDKLQKLVDTSQRPWTWRPDSVEPGPRMLEQFERVQRIREMFFAPGGKTPELAFTLKLSNLDPAATRFYLDIDGQHFEVKPGGESKGPVVWPGPQKGGLAIAVFEDRVGAPDTANGFNTPWAWFHLIDATGTPSVQAQADDLVSTLRLQTKYHAAQAAIEASNAISNPFASRDWRHFTCDP